MKIDFTIDFTGGVGSATILIFHAGNQVGDPLVFTESDTKSRDLSPGFYIASITGNSPPGGTKIAISEPTTPKTPDNISAGPITSAYTFHI